jgi:hypothetical protein
MGRVLHVHCALQLPEALAGAIGDVQLAPLVGLATETTATPSIVYDDAKTPPAGSPLAARLVAATVRCLARSRNKCIRPKHSVGAMPSALGPLPVHHAHVRHHPDPDPNTTLYLLHQPSSNNPRPNQTKPRQTTRSAQGALLHLSPESSGDVAVHTLLEKPKTTPPAGSGSAPIKQCIRQPPRSSAAF